MDAGLGGSYLNPSHQQAEAGGLTEFWLPREFLAMLPTNQELASENIDAAGSRNTLSGHKAISTPLVQSFTIEHTPTGRSRQLFLPKFRSPESAPGSNITHGLT